MKKRRVGKKLWSLALTLAMVLTMSVTALPAYAAGGSIKIVYNPQIDGLSSTPYTLYKVGSFGRYTAEEAEASGGKVKEGDVKIVLDSVFTGEGIPDLNGISVPEDTDDIDSEEYVAWESAWLAAADSLSKFLSTNAEAAAAIKAEPGSGTLTPQATAQSIGTYDNGFYLLVGEKQRVGNTYWWPVPVLMMVLNGDTTFSIADFGEDETAMRYNAVKMQSRPVVFKHIVDKHWDAESPESTRCDVRVGIYYGEGESLKTVDTVTLTYSEDTVQTYTWYSTEDEENGKKVVKYYTENPEENPSAEVKWSTEVESYSTWSVKELRETASEREALKYYESEIKYSMDGARESDSSSWDPSTNREEKINITNTFKKAKLVITKNLENYLNQNNANAMVVFEITGTVKGAKEAGSEETEEKVVYHNQVGMAFTGPGTNTLTIDNLPVNLDSLTVKEIYSTNYTCTDDAGLERTIDLAQYVTDDEGTKTYTVTFNNDYDGPPQYSKGIVNTYEGDSTGFKIVDRDGMDQPKPQVE